MNGKILRLFATLIMMIMASAVLFPLSAYADVHTITHEEFMKMHRGHGGNGMYEQIYPTVESELYPTDILMMLQLAEVDQIIIIGDHTYAPSEFIAKYGYFKNLRISYDQMHTPIGQLNLSSISSSNKAINLHEHDYTEEITKEASCSEEGEKTYVCSICGDSYTESLPMTEHSYKEIVEKEATCNECGEKKTVCTECGYIKSATIIGKMGHAYLISDFKDPTCTESGFKTYSCTRCGDVYTENIHALGHDESSQYQYVTKIGKMIIGGKTIYRCKRCGAVREVADGKYIHR